MGQNRGEIDAAFAFLLFLRGVNGAVRRGRGVCIVG